MKKTKTGNSRGKMFYRELPGGVRQQTDALNWPWSPFGERAMPQEHEEIRRQSRSKQKRDFPLQKK